MAEAPAIHWFRQDLRLRDNPALNAAIATGRPVLPLYILDDETPNRWRMGGASSWWLHHSLTSLAADLKKLGAQLCLRSGRADVVLADLVRETAAASLHWNRCYEPHAIARDTSIKKSLTENGIAAESYNGALLAEPWTVRTKQDGPFKVFTPFWNAIRERTPERPTLAPESLRSAVARSDRLEDWKLLPARPDWASGLHETWRPGENGAVAQLARFAKSALKTYDTDRDRPALPHTSRMSPYLHWGELSPRQIWHGIAAGAQSHGLSIHDGPVGTYLRELGWREFTHHLLYHWPALPEQPWREEFERFPWRDDEPGLKSWQRGLTGYPIVDAGMRELWHSGWMHNRVRMIAASFLIKDLLIPWQCGEEWFWDTLVDADLAQNATSWQWVAGSGADAAPYFRIFNPVLQGEKFDPEGLYVRRWLPELARLPNDFIHKPWLAPTETLHAAGIELGRDYPAPILDHGAARDRALAALKSMKEAERP
jgi:deoxyribodipyrimidine photo-lyase